MSFFGLHWVDLLILIVYIVIVLGVGEFLSRRTKTENDYFLGGRKLGKWFQFFLNFGNMTDPSGATATASSVYQQGIGGIWLLLNTLFLTPYYWFMNVWFRRSRLTTMADLFEDRFKSRILPTLYAVVAIGISVLTIGFGNVIALKTLQPIMAKPEAAYTEQDVKAVADYKEYIALQKQRTEVTLTKNQEDRYESLKGMSDRSLILPYVSYLQPWVFYVASSLLIAVFIMLGGLTASAVIDSLQAVLVMIISVILIPFGLAKIGGFRGLHERVPAQMFQIFGDNNFSEYTWYSIAAFLLMSSIAINAAGGNMNIGGSAKNELAARLGAVSGGFAKRFVTIAWGLTGLIALAIFGPNMTNPDQTWGLMTRDLLPVGFIGLMIIGILGGKLASLGATSVVNSALVVKNLYEPFLPGKSQRHYMIVARLTVPILLLLGIAVALFFNNALSLLKFIIAISVTWGAPILLIFKWRRLTKIAVVAQVFSCLLFIAVIPMIVSMTPSLRRSDALTVMTNEKKVTIEATATIADVEAGLATVPGAKFKKEIRIQPVAMFFEDGVARINPADKSSPREGIGRFNIEVYLISLFGIDVKNFTPPMLLTARYLVDTFFPLLILLLVSLMTRADASVQIARFYARLNTPVGVTPETDIVDVQLSYDNPSRFDHNKLFPRSNWEFTKWDRQDTLGFLGCCAFVGFILLLFKWLLLIGA